MVFLTVFVLILPQVVKSQMLFPNERRNGTKQNQRKKTGETSLNEANMEKGNVNSCNLPSTTRRENREGKRTRSY